MTTQNMTKGWFVAAATAAAAILPMTHTTAASAEDSTANKADANTNKAASWRAKTVDDVKAVVLSAGTEYKVQTGDTLSTIAQATGESVDDIAKANGLSDVHFITVGETLKLTPADKQDNNSASDALKQAAASADKAASAAAQVATTSAADNTQYTNTGAVAYDAASRNPLLLRQRMIRLVTLTQLDNARGSLRTLCHGLVTTGVTLLVGAPQLRQQVV